MHGGGESAQGHAHEGQTVAHEGQTVTFQTAVMLRCLGFEEGSLLLFLTPCCIRKFPGNSASASHQAAGALGLQAGGTSMYLLDTGFRSSGLQARCLLVCLLACFLIFNFLFLRISYMYAV